MNDGCRIWTLKKVKDEVDLMDDDYEEMLIEMIKANFSLSVKIQLLKKSKMISNFLRTEWTLLLSNNVRYVKNLTMN